MKEKRKCNIQFTEQSKADFEKLPKDLIQDCIKQLEKLEHDIEVGKKLRNQQGRDLSSCRKLYFAEATYRIVYRELNDNTKLVLEIEKTPMPVAEIVAIGEREGMRVYKEASERISENAITQNKDYDK